MVQQTPQTATVAIHSEVIEVSTNATHERCVLVGNRLVALAAAPVVDGANRPSEPRTPRLARQSPALPSSRPPVQREPEEVKGARTFPTRRSLRRLPERQ